MIMAVTFLIGLTSAWMRPATAATVAKFTTREARPQAYSFMYQAYNIGSTIGPAIGGLLASISYVWLFRVDGLVNIFCAVFMWVFFYKRNHVAVDDVRADHADTVNWWQNKFFVFFLCLTFLLGLMFLFLINIYPFYLKNYYQLSNFQIGLIYATNGFVIILLQMHFSIWVKKYNILRAIGVGGLIMALGYFLLPFYSGFHYALLCMIVLTIGEMATLPLMNNFVVEIAPSGCQGQYLGLMSSAFQIPMLLAPSVGAYIYAQFGPNALWYAVGVAGLVILSGFEQLKNKLPGTA
jgi:MFS family permease